MKKLLSIFIAICLSASCLFTLTSCELSNSHEHSYKEEWTHDEDFHWHACTSDNCTTQDSKEEHVLDVTERDGKNYYVCVTCGYEKEIPDVAEHEHVQAEALSYNNNFHWYACTFEGCPYRFEREEHNFLAPEIEQTADKIIRTYKCEFCNYSYTQETLIESIVEGEADWKEAFDNLEYVNYSMTVTFDDEYGHYTNSLIFADNACYVVYGADFGGYSYDYYSVKNDDGTFTTYEHYSYSDLYTISPDTSDSFYNGIKTESILDISFADHFDEFTYDEELGAYVCEGPIEATCFTPDGSVLDTLICINVVIKVADGKLTSISADYRFPRESEFTKSFIYFNIGITEVVVPQSVIENAVPGTAYPDEYPDYPEEESSTVSEIA